MSEVTESTQPAAAKPKRSLLVPLLITAAVVVMLPLIYVGVYFALPLSILSSYQAKNCGLALGLDNLYTGIYPAIIADTSFDGPVHECALYSLATSSQEKKSWQDAYNAYKSYGEIYPKGLFTADAHQQAAVVLMAWSRDLLAQKDYEQAAGNLQLVLNTYKDTPAAEDGGALLSQVYVAWGADQRDNSDFAGSETTLKAFQAWAETAKQSADVKTARHELAQTYLAWGLALQADKQFDGARAKLELAVSTDPEPLAKSGPAALARAAQAKLYSEWGDDLLDKQDFAGAIDRYKVALSLADAKDQPAAKDAVANGYVHWATSLSGSEDFLGALDQMNIAASSTGTEAGKKAVASAMSNTYGAFSKSSGKQAQKAMQTLTQAICEQQKPSTLPIFGLDKNDVLATIYGVDDRLPESVAAKTPGSLHYVACVEMAVETVETKVFYWAKLVRERYNWKVTLRSVPGGEVVEATGFTGGTPPPLPDINRGNYIDILLGGALQRYRGTNPDVADLAAWLTKVMK